MILDFLPEDANILRPLGPTEELVLHLQKQAGFCAAANNIACHIQLGNAQALTREILHQSLKIVIARHPLLRASIAPTSGSKLQRWSQGHYVFVATDETLTIPIQILEATDWREIMQRSFQESWTLDGGPLLRAFLIFEHENSTCKNIVLWLSHIVVDGLSLFSLMAELLNTVVELIQNGEVNTIASQPLWRDIWAYAPSKNIHWGQVLKRLSHYITTPFSPRVFHPPTDPYIAKTAFKTGYLYYRWSKEDSAHIVASAKAYHVSVGALIAAALVLTIAESAPQTSNTIGLSSIIDLRRRAQPSVPFDVMGHYASQVQTYYHVTPDRPLGGLAREVQNKVKRVLHSGIAWDVGRLIRLIAPVLLLLLQRGPIVFPYSILLSNVGRLQIPSRMGPFEILQYHGTADFSFGEGYIFLAFSTFNGQMTLDWTYGRVMPELIQMYTDRMLELLLTA